MNKFLLRISKTNIFFFVLKNLELIIYKFLWLRIEGYKSYIMPDIYSRLQISSSRARTNGEKKWSWEWIIGIYLIVMFTMLPVHLPALSCGIYYVTPVYCGALNEHKTAGLMIVCLRLISKCFLPLISSMFNIMTIAV